MGLIIHLGLGCFYTVTFIVGYRSLKAGEVDRSSKCGIATLLGVGADLGLYYLGLGLFS